MRFTEVLLGIRRRAAALPDDGKRPQAIEHVAREALAGATDGDQADQVRYILASFLGLGEGEHFDSALLDQISPKLVFRLDMIASGLLDFGRTNEAVRALRAVLVTPVR